VAPLIVCMSRIVLGILALAVVCAAQNNAATSAPQQAAQAKAKSSASAQSPQDKEIEAKIRAKLAKSKLQKDGLTVRVQGGVAYWEGNTGVVQHKGTATRMAKASGAKAVVNNIKVSDAAKQQAGSNLQQGPRKAQVTPGAPSPTQ
jgi:phosphate-selective porin